MKWINKLPIFIWPTKMGGYLLGLIFLVYILAIGYANNLLLIFCVILLSLSFLWFITTLRQVLSIRPYLVQIRSHHAGIEIDISLELNNKNEGIDEFKLDFIRDQLEVSKSHTLTITDKSLQAKLPSLKRGHYQWKSLILKSSAPFGLFQISRRIPIQIESFVYPALVKNFQLKTQEVQGVGSEIMTGLGNGDFFGLNSNEFEEARKISWKHYAQTGQVFIKEYENNRMSKITIELNLPGKENLKEDYLSRIASELTEAQRQGIPFEFRHHNFKTTQLLEALKELARC